jgi:hypothetical protein
MAEALSTRLNSRSPQSPVGKFQRDFRKTDFGEGEARQLGWEKVLLPVFKGDTDPEIGRRLRLACEENDQLF